MARRAKAKRSKNATLHFIGEMHIAQKAKPGYIELLDKALEKATASNARVAVALEIPDSYVRVLKRISTKLKYEDIKKIGPRDLASFLGLRARVFSGEDMIPIDLMTMENLVNYLRLMKKYPKVKWTGIDVSGLMGSELEPNDTKIKLTALTHLKETHPFVQKALSTEYGNILSKSMAWFVVDFMARNHVFRDRLKSLVKNNDYVIYAGGSAHSVILPDIKRELKKKRIDLKVIDEHASRAVAEKLGMREIAIYNPSLIIARAAERGLLNNIPREGIKELFDRAAEMMDDLGEVERLNSVENFMKAMKKENTHRKIAKLINEIRKRYK